MAQRDHWHLCSLEVLIAVHLYLLEPDPFGSLARRALRVPVLFASWIIVANLLYLYPYPVSRPWRAELSSLRWVSVPYLTGAATYVAISRGDCSYLTGVSPHTEEALEGCF